MARIYIPKETALVRVLRGFGAPNVKPPSPVIFDPSAPLSKNLKASYFFDYSARDYVAGNHGTVTGTASYTTTSRGPGIDFAGPSGNPSVDIPSIQTIIGAPNFTNDSFSLSALVKADSVSTRAGIFSQGSDVGDNGIYLFFEGSTTVRFSVLSWNDTFASLSLTATDWNFITATYDASSNELRVYANGEQSGAATNGSPSSSETNPKVGDVFEPFDRALNGQVLCFHVHKGALTAEEARRFYLDQWQVYEPANQSPFLIGTAAAGGLTIEPTGVSIEVGIGAPTLSPGAVDALPTGVSVEVGIGSTTLSAGATTAAPDGVSVEIGIGSPTLTAGAVDALPGGVSVEVGVGSPTLTAGAVNAAATGVSVEVGIGSPTVIAVAAGTCQPAGVPVEIGVGSPTLDAGAVNISASGVSIEVGIGSPTITSFADLLPSGISVPIGIGSPTLSLGAASVQPDGVSVEVGIGSPSLALQQQYAAPDGVSIPIGIGSPSLSGGSIWTEIPSVSTIWTEI